MSFFQTIYLAYFFEDVIMQNISYYVLVWRYLLIPQQFKDAKIEY